MISRCPISTRRPDNPCSLLSLSATERAELRPSRSVTWTCRSRPSPIASFSTRHRRECELSHPSFQVLSPSTSTEERSPTSSTPSCVYRSLGRDLRHQGTRRISLTCSLRLLKSQGCTEPRSRQKMEKLQGDMVRRPAPCERRLGLTVRPCQIAFYQNIDPQLRFSVQNFKSYLVRVAPSRWVPAARTLTAQSCPSSPKARDPSFSSSISPSIPSSPSYVFQTSPSCRAFLYLTLSRRPVPPFSSIALGSSNNSR